MTKQRIAFQGEPGANSHLAIEEVFPGAIAVPCATFEDALGTIRSGRADLGMIPIENSVAGRVADIHHLMPTSKLHIVGEHFQRVNHHLLARRGATRKSIRTVQSHVQALDQCRESMKKLGLNVLLAVANQRAIDSEIDPKLLATRKDISDVVLHQPSRLDDGWRVDLITADIRLILDGRAAIAIEGNRLVVQR